MGAGELILHLIQRAAVVAAIWGGRKAWQLYQEKNPQPKKSSGSSRLRPFKLLKQPAKEYKPATPDWLLQALKKKPRSVEEDSIISQCPAYQDLLKKLESGWTVEFGEGARALFSLDWSVAPLNHGSFGAEFKVVREVRQWCHAQLEAETVKFMEDTALLGVSAAVAESASLVGANWQDVVPVTNATEAANIVARSLQLRRGDIIVVSNLTYAAVKNTFARLAAQQGYNLMEVIIPLKAQQDPKLIVETFKDAIRGGYGRIRFAVLDHVSSWPPVLWPVKELVQLFNKAGAKVFVDGAHCIGNVNSIDIPSLGCQYYTTNLHKWMCTAKAAALLWVHPREQASCLPLITSHGMNLGFRGEFMWQGTSDPTPWITAPVSVLMVKALGHEKMLAYNRDLLQKAADLLLSAWGTTQTIGGPVALPPPSSKAEETEEEEVVDGGSMILVELPSMGPSLPPCIQSALALKFELDEEYKVEVPVGFWEGKLWVRISAQIYNIIGDYQRLADAVLKIKEASPTIVDSAL